MRVANGHLDYIDYLLDHRRWLAGAGLSLADFTAAAHLSVVDYLGALDWRGHKQTKDWYAVMKIAPRLPPAARRADGGDRPAGALRQGRLLGLIVPIREPWRALSPWLREIYLFR